MRRLMHLAPILPARTGNGLAMRAGLFTEALSGLGTLDVLVVEAAGRHGAPFLLNGIAPRIVATGGREDTRFQLIRRIADTDARLAAFRELGWPSACASLSLPVLQEAAQAICRWAPDALVVTRAYLLPVVEAAARICTLPPVLLDMDDDDGALARERARRAGEDGRSDDARWHAQEAEAFDRLAHDAGRRAAITTLASAPAAAAVAERLGLAPVEVVPNAVAAAIPRARPRTNALLFVGNLGYWPNVEGIRWFLDHVLERLRARVADVTLTVAGSGPTPELRAACSRHGARLVADPPSLVGLYAQAALAVVPLLSGSGSRIKILEAACHGVPVVSTRAGADGLGLDDERHLFISPDTPDGFAQACADGLGAPAVAQARAAALAEFVAEHHDRCKIVALIRQLVHERLLR